MREVTPLASIAQSKPFACPDCKRRFKKKDALADHRRDVHEYVAPPIDDPTCAECAKVALLVTGKAIYPHRTDLYDKNFWLCECGAYCGCHGVTTRPLGHPAGPETRRARSAAHAIFDPLWRSRWMTRQEAYARLANAMRLPAEECHIGMFTAEQATLAAQIAREIASC